MSHLKITYPAAALSYAVLMAVIFAIMSYALLAMSELFSISHLKLDEEFKVLDNFDNALVWTLSNAPPVELGSVERFDLYGTGADSVCIKRSSWGIFEYAIVSSFNDHLQYDRHFLIGNTVKAEKRSALYLCDRNRPLSLCGNTIIEGNCFLPKAGVRRAYIEGKTFSGEQLIQGSSLQAEKQLPEYFQSDTIFERYLRLIEQVENTKFSNLENGSKLSIDFKTDPTLLVIYDNIIKNVDLKGKVILVSNHAIEIDSTSKFEDVIVIAPSIRIISGFSGSGQYIATDSLIIEPEVRLNYPSALVLIKREMVGSSGLKMMQRSRLSGLIVLMHDKSLTNLNYSLTIEKGAEIEGLVYCDGALDLKGKIAGTVYTEKFLLSTPSSVYENHLLDAYISSKSLDESFVFPASNLTNGNRNIMKWLN